MEALSKSNKLDHAETICSAWCRTVIQHADRPAITVSQRTTTWGELRSRVEEFCSFLLANGLRPGDRVVLLLPNSLEYVIGYFGTLMAHGVIVGLNSELLAHEVSQLVLHCDARVVVARSQIWPALLQTGCGAGRCLVQADLSNPLPPDSPLVLWPNAKSTGKMTIDHTRICGDDVAQIIYTSGTTGQPKGVTLTHRALVANTKAINACLSLSREDRGFVSLPFVYSYGNSFLLTHMMAGAHMVLANDVVFWNRNLDQMISERITGFSAVPSTFSLLLSKWRLADRQLPDLRYVTCAGGALAPEHARTIRQIFPHVELHLMYGQTEAAARLSMLPPSHVDQHITSIGKGIPGVELRLIDQSGADVVPGEVGELVARGPNLMCGYWRDDIATASVLRDGWLHTGDLGKQDHQGYITIVGRRSEMIKSGGIRLAPQELEEAFIGLPGVAEVAVTGQPDALMGEVPIAFVVPIQSDVISSSEQLLKLANERLPRFKRVHSLTIVADLPRTSTGKVKRSELKQWVSSESTIATRTADDSSDQPENPASPPALPLRDQGGSL